MLPRPMALWLAGLAICLLAAAEGAENAPSKKVKERLGDNTVAILQGATRVEVFRIDPDNSAKGAKRIGGYAITATEKEQGQEFTGKLADALLDDATYFGDQAKCFEPGVAFRLWKEKESVEVVICFHCANLKLTTNGAKGDAINDGGHPKSGAFGGDKGSYGRLAKLAKEAFPDDKDIQTLKDNAK
jgi:hypothetical protein